MFCVTEMVDNGPLSSSGFRICATLVRNDGGQGLHLSQLFSVIIALAKALYFKERP